MSALVLLSAAAVVAWFAAADGAAPAWLAVAALAATAPALSLLRMPPLRLDWDGSRFGGDGADGVLDIGVDLGPWMLLRWRPAAAPRPGAARWLAVSARAIGPAGWHALRCALHAPPPAPAPAPTPNDG